MRSVLLALSLAFGVDTPALADTAQEIWNSKCKACHGEDGRAQTKTGKKEKIPDMTTPKWQGHISDSEIKKTITEGSDENPKMKPFKDKLSEQEIDSLVKHVRGFAKK
jgi:cytochrome c553